MVAKYSIIEFADANITDSQNKDFHMQLRFSVQICPMDWQDIPIQGHQKFAKQNCYKILTHKLATKEKQWDGGEVQKYNELAEKNNENPEQ